MACTDRIALLRGVSECLEEIRDLTQQQIDSLSTNVPFFNDLDRQLEQAVGEKERRLGALRQHEKEHGCG